MDYTSTINSAFLTWRAAFKAAYNKIERAKSKLNEVEKPHKGEDQQTREVKAAAARLEWREAEKAFAAEREHLQAQLNEALDKVRADVSAEASKAQLMNPADVDAAALAIMQSGAMGAADYRAFMEKYSSNATMTRLLARYAEMAADSMEDDKAKAQLFAVSHDAAASLTADTKNCDNLVYVAKKLSGQSGQGRELTLTLADKWEELTGGSVSE